MSASKFENEKLLTYLLKYRTDAYVPFAIYHLHATVSTDTTKQNPTLKPTTTKQQPCHEERFDKEFTVAQQIAQQKEEESVLAREKRRQGPRQ